MLDHIVRIGDLAARDRFAAASDDVVDAVLDGVGQLAAGEWAPLNRTGDTVGARWTPQGVTMPDGFVRAYRDYVEGGWGTIGVAEEFGGQGLPFAIQTAVLDTLGAANMSLALAPTLTVGAIEALAHHGSSEQQALYLPHLATGVWTGTMNLTEPQAGPTSARCAPRQSPLVTANGASKAPRSTFRSAITTWAPNIVHLVLARTPDAPAGTKGISLFLVPNSA